MQSKTKSNIYKKAQRFADVTKLLIMRGNMTRAKRCIHIAENLLINGEKEIKNAISNVYVHSLSCFMEVHNCNIKNLLPNSMKKEYYIQVCQ